MVKIDGELSLSVTTQFMPSERGSMRNICKAVERFELGNAPMQCTRHLWPQFLNSFPAFAADFLQCPGSEI
jgi:hypothetical protein